MGTPRKTVTEKLLTKLRALKSNPAITEESNKFKIRNKILLTVTKNSLKYSRKRYYESRKEDLIDDNFIVTILLNHENLSIVSTNPINPPNPAKKIIDYFRYITKVDYDSITLGAKENKIDGTKLYITKSLYDIINLIDKEEGKDKKIRFSNRISPFLSKEFNLKLETTDLNKDYGLLLKEIIASGQITQADILSLSSNLETGEASNIVIEKQVSKQVKWLIETIEIILEEKELTVTKAKNLGNSLFGFIKIDIIGPEHLMEMILTKYGQYTLFGVPALLNTNKYVLKEGISRSQFDLILITHLGDIEVVELKRPDKKILEYDKDRGKFYPSKDLSIALSQAERYISAVTKDNDDEYKIEGKKIREFINQEIGDTLYVESIRPSALIIIGSWTTITKEYSTLDSKTKSKISKKDYDDDSLRAYRELKSSFRNIKILNYSELMEHARTRLELSKTI